MPDHRVHTRSSLGARGVHLHAGSRHGGGGRTGARVPPPRSGTPRRPRPTASAIARRPGWEHSCRCPQPRSPRQRSRISPSHAVRRMGDARVQWAGSIHLCLCRGRIGEGEDVLVRMHSECVTGDSLGSLRCDCGIQLRHAFRTIAAEERGVLVYSTGHEGRGIGLANKLRAYMLQDRRVRHGGGERAPRVPVDERTFGEVAACLRALGVRSVRLMSNNRDKAAAWRRRDRSERWSACRPRRTLATSATSRRSRPSWDTTHPWGCRSPTARDRLDVASLLGEVRVRTSRLRRREVRPDDRRADRHVTGDARWISGEEERRTSHALRAACDAVLVGVGTILADDPQAHRPDGPGASPIASCWMRGCGSRITPECSMTTA